MKHKLLLLFIFITGLISTYAQNNGQISWSGKQTGLGVEGPYLTSLSLNYTISKSGTDIYFTVNNFSTTIDKSYRIHHPEKGLTSVPLNTFYTGSVTLSIVANVDVCANGNFIPILINCRKGDKTNVTSCEYFKSCNETPSFNTNNLSVNSIKINEISSIKSAFGNYYNQLKAEAKTKKETSNTNNSKSNNYSDNNQTNNNNNNISSSKNNTSSNSYSDLQKPNEKNNSKATYNLNNDPYYQNLVKRNQELNENLDQLATDGAELIYNAYNYFASQKAARERAENNKKAFYNNLAKENLILSSKNLHKYENSAYIGGNTLGYILHWDKINNNAFHYASATGFLPGWSSKIKRSYPKSQIVIENGKMSFYSLASYYIPVMYNGNGYTSLKKKFLTKKVENPYTDYELPKKYKIAFPITSRKGKYLYSSNFYSFFKPVDVVNVQSNGYAIYSPSTGYYNKKGETIAYFEGKSLIVNSENNHFQISNPFAYSEETGDVVSIGHLNTDNSIYFHYYSSFEDLFKINPNRITYHNLDLSKHKTKTKAFGFNAGEGTKSKYTDLINISNNGRYFVYANIEKHTIIGGYTEVEFNFIIQLFAYHNGIKICELPVSLLRLLDVYFDGKDNIVVVGIDQFMCLVKKVYNTKELITSAIEKDLIKAYNTISVDSLLSLNKHQMAIEKLESEKLLRSPNPYSNYYFKKYYVYSYFDLEKSYEVLKEMNEEFPQYSMYTNIYSAAYYINNKKYEEAKKIINAQDLPNLPPYIQESYLSLQCRIEYYSGNKQNGLQYLKEIIKLNEKGNIYAQSCFLLGKRQEAMEIFNELIKDDPKENYFTLCCLYSLENEKDKAIHYLEKALQNGYNNYYMIEIDHDLDNVRSDERFKNIIYKYKHLK